MNPDVAFRKVVMRPRVRFTELDATKERAKGYASKGWFEGRYRFPEMATIHVEVNRKEVRLLSPQIGLRRLDNVKARARHLLETYPDAAIYITIPSKANQHG